MWIRNQASISADLAKSGKTAAADLLKEVEDVPKCQVKQSSCEKKPESFFYLDGLAHTRPDQGAIILINVEIELQELSESLSQLWQEEINIMHHLSTSQLISCMHKIFVSGENKANKNNSWQQEDNMFDGHSVTFLSFRTLECTLLFSKCFLSIRRICQWW